MEPIVVLFDGFCVLCNRFADFLLRHDTRGTFLLGTLQSPSGQECLKRAGLPANFVESVVVIDRGHVYTQSTAVLRIARMLAFPWPVAAVLLLVPRRLRDAVYTWVARNRNGWFGKRESCRIPSKSERDRFLP